MSKAFYNLTNDIIFKIVFAHPKKTDLLKCLLNALLKLKGNDLIKNVTVLNPFNDKEFLDDKVSIVDIKAEDTNGFFYNIEMQIQVPAYWSKRALYYASKLYTSQLDRGSNYQKLKKTISISILNQPIFKETEEIHNIYTFCNKKTFKELDSNLIEMHFIELSKFNKD
ncbi:MAG: transposase, partial [Candidatus Cloacimonadota bacterium]